MAPRAQPREKRNSFWLHHQREKQSLITTNNMCVFGGGGGSLTHHFIWPRTNIETQSKYLIRGSSSTLWRLLASVETTCCCSEQQNEGAWTALRQWLESGPGKSSADPVNQTMTQWVKSGSNGSGESNPNTSGKKMDLMGLKNINPASQK